MSQAARALVYALDSGALAAKRAFFLRAEAPPPLHDVDCEQSFRPEFLRLKQAGKSVAPRLCQGGYALGLILLTKHKEESFANIARGWTLLDRGGTLVCAGANDDGAASLERQAGKALGLAGSLSKFHCRVFWFVKGERAPPAYWRGLASLQPVGSGPWLSQPGIFSWDRIDDGSALLARHLPSDLAGRVADFGCGWGYLAERVLAANPGIFSWDRIDDGSALLAQYLPRDLTGRVADFGCGWGYLAERVLAANPGITQVDLIDAEYRAIEAAQANVTDSRAAFHWLDLTSEPAPASYDAIVCNPPFHTGRASTPALGQQVIEAAARALRPGGRLYIVANRGLPYEPLLKGHFTSFETLADNNKFRVSLATR